jgi:hypothetical protein
MAPFLDVSPPKSWNALIVFVIQAACLAHEDSQDFTALTLSGDPLT